MLEYVAIGLMIVLSTLVALIAIGLGTIFGPKKQSEAKALPYESGMIPYGEGTRRMPVRFYLIAVLFILFDIEVVFFLPWAIVFRQLGLFGLLRHRDDGGAGLTFRYEPFRHGTDARQPAPVGSDDRCRPAFAQDGACP